MLSSHPVIRSSNYHVVISGGGFAGATLAIALAKTGLEVLLVEKSGMNAQLEPTFDGRVSAIALGSKNILDSLGAWNAMQPHAQPILDIRVSDGDTPFFLHYDHDEIKDATGGAPFGYIIENRYIRHALHQALASHKNIHVAERSAIDAFEANSTSVHLTINKNTKCSASLLVGADGKFSAIRSMAGIKDVRWAYEQTAIVCTISHEKPHEGLAQERFLPAGPFAILPMTGNRSSLVWVEPNDRAPLYLDLPDEELEQEISERTGNCLGKIKIDGKRFSYPLSLVHAKNYITGRVALIGDAALDLHADTALDLLHGLSSLCRGGEQTT